VLADFRSWLAAALSTPTADTGPSAEPPPDLHTLLGQMLALRQEVNLQTRAVRNQQELNAETLRLLAEAVEVLRERSAPPPVAAGDDSVRPLLKTLVDVYDALSLAEREIRRGGTPLTELVEEAIDAMDDAVEELAAPLPEQPPTPAPPPPRSVWSRLLGAPSAPVPAAPVADREPRRQRREELSEQLREGSEDLARVREVLPSLLSGYQMGLQRLERALAQSGLQPIPAVGLPFDPERMEVLEATSSSGRPAGEVLEEIRRGYLHNGRIFRYAQVRVARG
jgi:molecular chaperone GrpE